MRICISFFIISYPHWIQKRWFRLDATDEDAISCRLSIRKDGRQLDEDFVYPKLWVLFLFFPLKIYAITICGPNLFSLCYNSPPLRVYLDYSNAHLFLPCVASNHFQRPTLKRRINITMFFNLIPTKRKSRSHHHLHYSVKGRKE